MSDTVDLPCLRSTSCMKNACISGMDLLVVRSVWRTSDGVFDALEGSRNDCFECTRSSSSSELSLMAPGTAVLWAWTALMCVRTFWDLGPVARFLRAMSTGSFSSTSSLMMSTSTMSTWSSSSPRNRLTSTMCPMMLWVQPMFLLRSIDIWWRSLASAGPRSLQAPRKNISVLMKPVPSSSRRVKSRSRSFAAMSSIFRRSFTRMFFIIACSSVRSSSPLPSVSASWKIFFSEAKTCESIACFSLCSFSSFARAMLSVLSTMTPTMVFRSAKKPKFMKTMKRMTTQLSFFTSGQAIDPQESRVRTWHSEYIDFGTVSQ
mmetsp:Transcript_95381/g.269970  ORF Transcript_95381/g.269970 Transcript_95381/m.269970 type:complete len:318 (+) Transcript_95381:129-1082(+)